MLNRSGKDDGLKKMLRSAFGIKAPAPPKLQPPQTMKPQATKPAPVSPTARVFRKEK